MRKTIPKKIRGVFERPPGSGIWWVQYFTGGRRHREKIGTRSKAIELVEKRRSDARAGVKLPENIRSRPVTFGEIAKGALQYSSGAKRSHYSDTIRMPLIVQHFGNRCANDILPEEIQQWLNATAEERDWAQATKNRYLALIKLTYRQAEENRKIKAKDNPARLVKLKKENNARERYLNQFTPMPTKVAYLKDCHDEESRLRRVIAVEYSHHLPEFEIALHCGMRASELYRMQWPHVDTQHKILKIPETKYGPARDVQLNSAARGVLEFLRSSAGESEYVFLSEKGERLLSNRHWFPKAVKKAGIRENFTWHCLRHTFGSRLAQNKVDIRKIAELMGHQTLEMAKRYTHLRRDDLQEAVETLVSQPSATTGATSSDTALSGGSKAVQ
jgi:integrase